MHPNDMGYNYSVADIRNIIKGSIELKERIAEDSGLISMIDKAARAVTGCLAGGGKVLFCGNGGSAADAQHLAAELSGRFGMDREPLFAEALHVNTSYLTSVANDYSFEEVYARLVRAMGREGDVLVALSTSGRSANVLNAVREARSLRMVAIGMTGEGGGEMKGICDLLIEVPSGNTARIQEAHIMIGHIICHLVEDSIFRNT